MRSRWVTPARRRDAARRRTRPPEARRSSTVTVPARASRNAIPRLRRAGPPNTGRVSLKLVRVEHEVRR